MATVLLSIGLVPWMGATGACFAAIGCELAGLPFFHYEFSKYVSVNFVDILMRLTAPTGAMIVALVLLRQHVVDNLFVSVAVGAIAFSVVALATCYVTKKDVEMVGVIG